MHNDDGANPDGDTHMICGDTDENNCNEGGPGEQAEAPPPFDCRKNCLHCGTHCIYLGDHQPTKI